MTNTEKEMIRRYCLAFVKTLDDKPFENQDKYIGLYFDKWFEKQGAKIGSGDHDMEPSFVEVGKLIDELSHAMGAYNEVDFQSDRFIIRFYKAGSSVCVQLTYFELNQARSWQHYVRSKINFTIQRT